MDILTTPKGRIINFFTPFPFIHPWTWHPCWWVKYKVLKRNLPSTNQPFYIQLLLKQKSILSKYSTLFIIISNFNNNLVWIMMYSMLISFPSKYYVFQTWRFWDFCYIHNWLFWIGFQLGISNMKEFLYIHIFKGINTVSKYFQIHYLYSYRTVVLILNILRTSNPPWPGNPSK